VLEGAEIHEASAPPVKISGADGRIDGIMATAEEKTRVFMAERFQQKTGVDGETWLPDSMVSVSAREVCEALFTQSIKEAPGADSIDFRELRMLWQWEENCVVSLVQGYIIIGYHSCTWNTAKSIMLRN
jgi:hypothetical protein